MPGAPAETLEKMIFVLVNSKYPDQPPSEDQFLKEASDVRQRMGIPVTDQEFEQILRNLKAALLISMDVGVFLYDPNSDHQSWLPGRRADTEFFYWNRYKRYLEAVKGWNTRVTGPLDTVSDEILDLLGDPKSQQPWFRRGLVLGDVQSGKTANYTAICNKAADTGYKVIIVLAGLTESLRVQTQERLDKEFGGRSSKHLLSKAGQEIRHIFDGVGKIDRSRQIAMFTTVNTDFNSAIVKSNRLTLKNVTETALFVVKKNSRILTNLQQWLVENNADYNEKINMSLLLIDDEADNASINTKKPEEDPTAVNAAIRSILHTFTKSSYLGITATPFANIFIHPEAEHEMLGDDLFPKDFIYVLSPPSNYIGADAMHGGDGGYRSALQELDKEELDQFFPFKHKKGLAVNDLPPSMFEALGYFILCNAIRDVRGDVTDHRSMLINVSRFTDVQTRIKDLIVEWLLQVRSDVRNYSGLSEEKAMNVRSLQFLRSIWVKHALDGPAGVSWGQLQHNYLNKAIGPIEVRAVNQRTGAASLDYYSHKIDGFRVIAVGGNSLSRGLTLEGLCVSYIYRSSHMYDTLLQMGRWFGYRPNYDDIFKVWMTPESIDWYGYVNDATNELKAEIHRMNRLQLTPREFGLKVRQDPRSLIATALNKMRTATVMTRPVSVQGVLLETPRLKSSPEVLRSNEKVFRAFVAILDRLGAPTERKRGYFWEDVPKQPVVSLLRGFETHPWHMSFQGAALADFIEGAPDLGEWDVFMPEGEGSKKCEFGGQNRALAVRPQVRVITAEGGMLLVSGTKVRVGAGGITRTGLPDEDIKKVEATFRSEHPGKKNVPDSAYLIEGRKPLLMLHVIEPKGKDSVKVPVTLFAIGIGLPRNDEPNRVATYVVNLVELRSVLGAEDDEGDDDDD